jgi:hypothetical protein
MKIKYLYIIVVLVFMFFSCRKEETENIDNLIVVDAYLYEGEPVDSIYLSKSISYESSDTVYPPVTDAKVVITWNHVQYTLDSIGNGYYSYKGTDLYIKVGNSYSISIQENGQTVTSSTIVPQKPSGLALSDTIIEVDTAFTFRPQGVPPGNPDTAGNTKNSIELTWNNPDNDYFYVVVESADSNATNIASGGDSIRGRMGGPQMFRFRSEPFIDSRYRISSNSLTKFGKHIVKLYGVNQEYANLYENRQQDSRNLSEPVTNINNGLGIFTAFSYAEAVFYVKRK